MSTRPRALEAATLFFRRHLRILLGLAVSAVSLYYLLTAVELPKLWETFRQGNYLYLIPALGLLVLTNLARAVRWRILIGQEPELPVRRLFGIVNIGYLFNNVLPAKAGEVVRAYLVGRVVTGGIGQAASTLVVERLLDVLTLVVLLGIILPFVELPAWVARAGLLFGAVSLGGALALVILARYGERGLDLVWRYVGRLPVVGHPKVRSLVANVVGGFGVLTEGRVLAAVAFWSGAIWLGYAVFNYVLMAVFSMALPFVAAATVLCATGFSMVLPSSPGAVGPFEYAAVLALSVFGVAQSPASAYAFGLHIYTNVVLIVLGLVGLYREGLSFSGIRREAVSAESAGEPGGAVIVEERPS